MKLVIKTHLRKPAQDSLTAELAMREMFFSRKEDCLLVAEREHQNIEACFNLLGFDTTSCFCVIEDCDQVGYIRVPMGIDPYVSIEFYIYEE